MREEPGVVAAFEVRKPIAVKTYDIDFAGIVSNIVYIRWLEDMRLAVLDELYPLDKLLAHQLFPTLVETRIQYRLPLTIRDQPLARMWVKEMRRLKLILAAEFLVGEQIHAQAEQVGCVVEAKTGRAAPFPSEMVELYQAQLT
jgi:acyl-CoA thioester hydrolase